MRTTTLAMDQVPPRRWPWLDKLSCALYGHHVDNHRFREAGAHHGRTCRCGVRYLGTNGAVTRIRHTLSCFFGHHTYERLATRDGCHEYVCVQCGHPLLFAVDSDPYSNALIFRKKVRYLCGLFGHRVAPVTKRDGLIEYACRCGHTFLREDSDLRVVRHPAICVAAGHWIRFLTTRGGYSEYICRNCGHPFCFAGS